MVELSFCLGDSFERSKIILNLNSMEEIDAISFKNAIVYYGLMTVTTSLSYFWFTRYKHDDVIASNIVKYSPSLGNLN